MYVRKFEADTLDEALKSIKSELGPDAIILKTITNKGLKGAFKKKKIEITAAISEKNYTDKAEMDHHLDNQQKEQFYSNEASYISEKIQHRAKHNISVGKTGSYGHLGLNRQVTKANSGGVPSDLDQFLKDSDNKINYQKSSEKENSSMNQSDNYHKKPSMLPASTAVSNEVEELCHENKNKIFELEKRILELTKSIEQFEKKEGIGVRQIRVMLKSLNISESFIQFLLRKAVFELSEDEVEDVDIVYEFALREISSRISTELPLFSTVNTDELPVVTVSLSENCSGQTTTLEKISALKKNSIIIKYNGADNKSGFIDKVLGLKVIQTKSIAEIVANCRKAIEQGTSVFIDFKNSQNDKEETKKFIDGLRRAFGKIEVLITLSAIHSEIYNKSIVSRYRSLADGLMVTNLDLCLNFGALFNIVEEIPDLPFKFFGTGSMVPDDLETATVERILSGIFQIK